MSKKSRKLIRSTPVGGDAAVEGEVEAVVPVAPERSFFFLPDAPPLAVDEQELHGLMKLWRHGRATRSMGQVLQDSYVMLFSVVMIGAMVVSVVLRAQVSMMLVIVFRSLAGVRRRPCLIYSRLRLRLQGPPSRFPKKVSARRPSRQRLTWHGRCFTVRTWTKKLWSESGGRVLRRAFPRTTWPCRSGQRT